MRGISSLDEVGSVSFSGKVSVERCSGNKSTGLGDRRAVQLRWMGL